MNSRVQPGPLHGSIPGLIVLTLLLAISVPTYSDTLIRVVYPKAEQNIGAVDSTFIFGSVGEQFDPKHEWLEINGETVEVHQDGGFLAFLPIAPGEFEFQLRILRQVELPLSGEVMDRLQLLADTAITVFVPEPDKSLPTDSLAIAGDYRPPSGDLVLRTADRLVVRFRGTPGMVGWFSIPGAVDSIPVSEMEPRQQPYWGEAVFGIGAIPDSILIRGIYAGFYDIPDSIALIDTRICYHLATPADKYIRPSSTTEDSSGIDDSARLVLRSGQVATESGYRVSANRPDYPRTVRFIDSVQTIRYGPVLGYFSIFQPAGVEALAVGRTGDWYRLQLSATQFAWANKISVVELAPGILPPSSNLASVRSFSNTDNVTVKCGLAGKHPFRVYVDDLRNIRIQLFGVTSNTDWIRYDFADPLITLTTWSQPEDGLYEIKLQLSRDLWGYDAYYEGNSFKFRLNRAPEKVRNLWGKTIVIDPGHASDLGAVGPTGLTEAQANLGIALALRKALQKKGAKVVMTRDDMSHVSLYDRPVIAKQADADLFVSIHNNALPDGVNPFANHGVSTYYYHPQSIELARAIQTEMLKATKMPDFGFYHGNLAVNRPTQYPAVLVECAFMMIPEQEALLKTERYQKKVADAIRKGIENFLKQYHERNH